MAVIQVNSEIAPLKKVMLHRPNEELLNLTPSNLQELLFDDIPDLEMAQKEHDEFAKTLQEAGIEVIYLEELMRETLASSNEVKQQFIKQYIAESGVVEKYQPYLNDHLNSLDEKQIVNKTIAGIKADELLLDEIDGDELVTKPMPNLYFTRDNFTCLGDDGVILYKMFSQTRRRETIYGEYIFNYHPSYKGVKIYSGRDKPYHMEGGDVIILSEHSLAIGVSQRTKFEAIEQFAKELFVESKFDSILAVTIPSVRTCMHLDTVLNRIDYDKFVIYPGILEGLTLKKLVKGDNGEVIIEEVNDTLASTLSEIMGVSEVKFIKCGGDNKITSEREQWSDGANTLCIAPGKVIVYDRNRITNQLLKDAGIEVITIPSSELSRGRGGPRCMSMPFWRG